MVTLSVAWVTIPSPNLQGGPCSHPPPPQSHLGVPGFGIGYVCGGPVPLILLGACRKGARDRVAAQRAALELLSSTLGVGQSGVGVGRL